MTAFNYNSAFRPGKRPADVGMLVRSRLLSLCPTTNLSHQNLLTRYVNERVLYRVGESQFRDNMTLKGGMLLWAWQTDLARPTRDLDFSVKHLRNDPAEVRDVFAAILRQPVDDGLKVDLDKMTVKPIRETDELGGLRIEGIAGIGGAEIKYVVDVGFSGSGLIHPVSLDYPSLLDLPPPRIFAYDRETVIAEKSEAAVKLGIGSGRIKDVYDMWLLSNRYEFDMGKLGNSVAETFRRRGSELPVDVPPALSDTYVERNLDTWAGFWRKHARNRPVVPFDAVMSEVRTFVMPVYAAARKPEIPQATWSPMSGWEPKPAFILSSDNMAAVECEAADCAPRS